MLTAAIAQVPTAHRRKLLIRAAGASHQLLDWITGLDAKRGRSVEYSVGYALTDKVRDAIARLPKTAWSPPITADGDPREHGDAVEITGMLDLTTWRTGMRVIVRREHPHPGASLSLFEHADGWRYHAVATNSPVGNGGQVAFLEARSRSSKRGTGVHARVEDRIRHAKDAGIGRFPSREFAINTAWALVASIAVDLIAWLRLLALPAALKACEPKTLRYRFLHVPARLTHSARRRHLRFPATWPWATEIVAAFTTIHALTPVRTCGLHHHASTHDSSTHRPAQRHAALHRVPTPNRARPADDSTPSRPQERPSLESAYGQLGPCRLSRCEASRASRDDD